MRGECLATILEVYRTVFPGSPQRGGLGSLPRLPTDVFAFAAHLVERSGAYHHISPEVLGPAPNYFRRIVVGDAQRNRAVAIGRAWRNGPVEPGARLPSPPPEVDELWARLNSFRSASVFEPIDDVAAAPDWWIICLDLVMITDEACKDIGFQTTNPFFDFFMQEYTATDLSSGDEFRRVQRAPFDEGQGGGVGETCQRWRDVICEA